MRLSVLYGVPIGWLQRNMTSQEFTELQAYEALTGPIGYERTDINAAIIAQTVANAHRRKRSRAFKIQDFIPEFKPRRTEPIGTKELKIKLKQALLIAKKKLESDKLRLQGKKRK